MKVLVCGDRNWTNHRAIHSRLGTLPVGTIIIHGAARGVDTLAADAARDLGLYAISFPADWERYGRGAGPIRNRQMLDANPDLVIAFHPDLAMSKGTADCVREAQRRGIPTEVIK